MGVGQLGRHLRSDPEQGSRDVVNLGGQPCRASRRSCQGLSDRDPQRIQITGSGTADKPITLTGPPEAERC